MAYNWSCAINLSEKFTKPVFPFNKISPSYKFTWFRLFYRVLLRSMSQASEIKKTMSVSLCHAWTWSMGRAFMTFTGYYFTLIEHCPGFFVYVVVVVIQLNDSIMTWLWLTVYCTWLASSWTDSPACLFCAYRGCCLRVDAISSWTESRWDSEETRIFYYLTTHRSHKSLNLFHFALICSRVKCLLFSFGVKALLLIRRNRCLTALDLQLSSFSHSLSSASCGTTRSVQRLGKVWSSDGLSLLGSQRSSCNNRWEASSDSRKFSSLNQARWLFGFALFSSEQTFSQLLVDWFPETFDFSKRYIHLVSCQFNAILIIVYVSLEF